MASKKEDPESAGSYLEVTEMKQLSDLQSYKDFDAEFTEFIKEAMNNHTAAISNQIAILKEITTEMTEEKKTCTEHDDNLGDILIAAEKVEESSQEFSSLFSALFEKIDRIFQNYDLVWKKAVNDQTFEVSEDEGDLPVAFIHLIEKKQLNFFSQTLDKLWSYRRRNELIYISKKRRFGGSKSEEIFLKRGQSLQLHQPQIKMKNLLKIEVGGMQKDWKKYKKKARMED